MNWLIDHIFTWANFAWAIMLWLLWTLAKKLFVSAVMAGLKSFLFKGPEEAVTQYLYQACVNRDTWTSPAKVSWKKINELAGVQPDNCESTILLALVKKGYIAKPQYNEDTTAVRIKVMLDYIRASKLLRLYGCILVYRSRHLLRVGKFAPCKNSQYEMAATLDIQDTAMLFGWSAVQLLIAMSCLCNVAVFISIICGSS